MPIAQKLLLIAVAGALGSLARFGLSIAVQKSAGTNFPWSTLVVNGLGCFLFGLVWNLSTSRISEESRLIILVGFMGAFTTYSTYSFETVELMRQSAWLKAALNVLAQTLLGLAAVLVGIMLARKF